MARQGLNANTSPLLRLPAEGGAGRRGCLCPGTCLQSLRSLDRNLWQPHLCKLEGHRVGPIGGVGAHLLSLPDGVDNGVGRLPSRLPCRKGQRAVRSSQGHIEESPVNGTRPAIVLTRRNWQRVHASDRMCSRSSGLPQDRAQGSPVKAVSCVKQACQRAPLQMQRTCLRKFEARDSGPRQPCK